MKTQAYILLILLAYLVGITVGLLCNVNVIFLLIVIPTSYALWRGHKFQQKMDKLLDDITNELKEKSNE